MTSKLLTAEDFRRPAVLLSGPVDYDMYKRFRDQLQQAPEDGLIVIELSTFGGPSWAGRSNKSSRWRRIACWHMPEIGTGGGTFPVSRAAANR